MGGEYRLGDGERRRGGGDGDLRFKFSQISMRNYHNSTVLKDKYLYLRLGDGERRRRGGEGERRLRTGEGDRLFLDTQTPNDELSVWHCGRTPRQIIQVDFPDLGETSLCRRLGEGVRLRLLLTSPFLALGPDFGLLGPSSSEEEDPESNIKETHHQKKEERRYRRR